MLLIYGIAAIVAGAVLAAAARLVFATPSPQTPPRRLPGSQILDIIAVSLIFGGSLTLLIFLADYETQTDVPLQMIAAAILAAAGTVAVRLIRRRTGPIPAAEMPEPAGSLDIVLPMGPDDPAPADDHHKRAA